MIRLGSARRTAIGTRSSALPLLLAAALLAAAPSRGAGIGAIVQGSDGEPVQHAVVYALPVGADGAPLPASPRAEIDQIDKEFVPSVTAVQVGTRVHFPNRDQIRHHVYSFSDAKTFEIPLYEGTPAQPILFDKPGPVVLGCNIHDWMRGWVFVVDTPLFAVTGEDGRATLDAAPGDYSVRVWHPELDGDPEGLAQRVSVAAGEDRELRFAIEQRRVWRPRRSPSLGGPGSYR